MNDFYTKLDNLLGDDDALSDIRVTVRRCWFYDFNEYPVRIWQGEGKLHTSDDNEWLGSINSNGQDLHIVPAIQDGRDGSSTTYNMKINIIDLPGRPALELYEKLKTEQWRVAGRKLTCYLAIFDEKEGLRPQTPLIYFQELFMMSSKFSERLDYDASGKMIKKYSTSVSCKDNNFGRSNVPGGTYADTIQKRRAKENGVLLDRGSEFLALLANRTYQIP